MIEVIGDPNAWGFLIGFLDEDDPRPAREQFDDRARGGWFPAPAALKFNVETGVMTYPGDPPFHPISVLIFRNETLLLYQGSFVVILQPDGTWECSRMD